MDSPGPLGCGPQYTRTPGPIGVCDALDPALQLRSLESKANAAPANSSQKLTADSANLEDKLVQHYFGLTIEKICGKYGKLGDDFNHCAHFVSHVLGLRITGAALCSNVAGSRYTYEERRKGYCIRVNQIFNSCAKRAYWDDKVKESTCFIVATIAANIDNASPITIGTMSRKHIGFHIGGVVYHYSNSRDKVIKQTVDEFKRHYRGDTVLLRADLP